MYGITISFDVKNVTGGITIESNTNFSFDPKNGLSWNDIALVNVDNQTFRKPLGLELSIFDVKEEDWYKIHYASGSLFIGNKVWNPLSAAIYTDFEDNVFNFAFYSCADHIPDQTNNY